MVGLLAAIAALVGAGLVPSTSWPAGSLAAAFGGDHGAATDEDGALPDGVTPFDEEHPGIADLDPDLLQALRRAAGAAATDGVTVEISSGWRSPAYQDQLLREAVADHGSEAEALRWVATPDTSAHVSGDAVDVGPAAAWSWLAQHGSRYGLCPVYGNEPWHFELRPDAVSRACPPVYPDPTHDPRLQH